MAAPAERRSFIRLNIKANIRYRVVQSASESLKQNPEAEQLSVTKNVSAGGLVFAANKHIPVGSIVELKIELPMAKNAIECLGRVLRVDEIQVDQAYDVVAHFLDLSGRDRARLDQFVHEEVF